MLWQRSILQSLRASLRETQRALRRATTRLEPEATELARTVDLAATHALPEAPWFEKEAWSNRRVLMHLVAETAQHAGHADILRETIDGQKTMG